MATRRACGFAISMVVALPSETMRRGKTRIGFSETQRWRRDCTHSARVASNDQIGVP